MKRERGKDRKRESVCERERVSESRWSTKEIKVKVKVKREREREREREAERVVA